MKTTDPNLAANQRYYSTVEAELPPLLDDHTKEVLRLSNPALSWLRQVAHEVNRKAKLDEALQAWEIADLCVNGGVELGRDTLTPDQQNMLIGRRLNSVFSESNEVTVDVYTIRKETRQEYDSVQRRTWGKHYYWFEIRP